MTRKEARVLLKTNVEEIDSLIEQGILKDIESGIICKMRTA
jgi:hypothetical protein